MKLPYKVALGAISLLTLLAVIVLDWRTAERSLIYGGVAMEPTIPAGSTVIFGLENPDDLKRGEIAAFYPDSSRHLIFFARVVGFPGDTIRVNGGGSLIINETLYSLDSLEDIASYPNAEILESKSLMFRGDEVFEIGEDEMFLVCDNWKRAVDSRTLGAVPKKQIIGKILEVVEPAGSSKKGVK